jgi:hypothetical protein
MSGLFSLALLAISAANLVEPLSNGLSLSMTRTEIFQRFGPPAEQTWDPGVFGYPEFMVETGGVDELVWRLTIKNSISLSSGIHIGSSRQEVGRIFGAADEVVYQRYRLRFRYAQDQLMRIEIEPARGEFAPSKGRRGKSQGASANGLSTTELLGTWYGSNVKVQVTLEKDGSYLSTSGPGRYRLEGEKIVFTGPLGQWNHGRARVSDQAMVFHWKDGQGSVHWVAFSREKEDEHPD